MKSPLPVVVSFLALAIGIANFFSLRRDRPPREVSNTEWLESLPNTPGVCRLMPLPETLELLGYDGFRCFARLPKIEVKPGMALYYLEGTNTYGGDPNRGHLRVIRKGLGMEDIVKAGGSVSLADLPDGFEFTVFFRRDAEKAGISGFERFGFVDPSHHGRVSGGGSPFSVRLPAYGGTGSTINGESQVQLGKQVEFASRTFLPENDPGGTRDDERAVTVKWYYAFQVAPRAF